MPERKKIAAIVTEYHPLSHADVIVTKFLKGFPTDDGLLPPRVEIVSAYIDQDLGRDIGRGILTDHGVPIYPSIPRAMTLGGKEMAVDGVLLIGEHGDYARNEKGQDLYPRKPFMEQICGVIAVNRRPVPVFCDKHLSYNWADATWMVGRARELGVPFMAGSSAPVGWRRPWLEHEPGCPLEEALSIGYGGLDSYGFHAIETLQCMVERRPGGETGVAAVTCLEGEAVWRSGDRGLWSRELGEAACSLIERKSPGSMRESCPNPAVFLIEFRDGLRAATLMLNGHVTGFAYAGRVNGEIRAAEVALQHGPPHAHFSYLSLNVEEMFITGAPSWPVERTLLTTGILESALESRHRGGVRLETPHLTVAYRPADRIPFRPRGPRPSGATLEPWPPRAS